MESKDLLELRGRLSMLPALMERMDKLCARISEAEREVKTLMAKFEAESLDVEQLKAESLSVYILKLVGRYEGKMNKETEQMLAAKIGYDKAAERVKELQLQRHELGSRIAELNQGKQMYEAELQRREEAIRNNVISEASLKYRQLEAEQESLSRQLIETEEALGAASRVINTANSAMEQLDSAENWATYDVWFKSGIISHMAKYEHIDNAEEDFNRLSSQMDDLRRELSDISISGTPEFSGIDSTTRAVDFWFDNIFTDLNVRSRIREDSEQLRTLSSQVYGVIHKLESNKSAINRKLEDIELKKNELIIVGQ